MVIECNAGDIVWLDFDPSLGHEQGGRCPAIVICPQVYSKASGLIHVLPVTTKSKGYPFEVSIRTPKIKGYVLVDQIMTADWSVRNIKKISTIAGTKELETIKEYLRLLLEL